MPTDAAIRRCRVSGVFAVVFIGLAIVAVAFLRHIRPYGHVQPETAVDGPGATDELYVAAGSN